MLISMLINSRPYNSLDTVMEQGFFSQPSTLKNSFSLWKFYIQVIEELQVQLKCHNRQTGLMTTQQIQNLIEGTKYYMNQQNQFFDKALALKETNDPSKAKQKIYPKCHDVQNIIYEDKNDESYDQSSQDEPQIDTRKRYAMTPLQLIRRQRMDAYVSDIRTNVKEEFYCSENNTQAGSDQKEDSSHAQLATQEESFDYEKFQQKVQNQSNALLFGLVESKTAKRSKGDKTENGKGQICFTINFSDLFIKDRKTGRDVLYPNIRIELKKSQNKNINKK